MKSDLPARASVLFAVFFHGVAAAALLVLPAGGLPSSTAANGSADGPVWFRLAAVPEGSSLAYMPGTGAGTKANAALSGPLSGIAGNSDSGDASPAEAPTEAELAELLAADREALRAELEKLSEVAKAAPLPATVMPAPLTSKLGASEGGSSRGPEGAIRELNLEGYPQDVVDEFMQRYKLRVAVQEFTSGRRGQSFLSSASRGPGAHYFGGLAVPAGVYEVFQLSHETVGLMSRLEEDAMRERGMEPLKTRIIRVVFGIVKSAEGEYELGIKSLEAEKVSL